MKSISRKYNVLLVVVSIVCIVLLFTGTSTIKISKTSLTKTDNEISQVFKFGARPNFSQNQDENPFKSYCG